MGTYSWKYTFFSTNDTTAYLDITMPSVTASAASFTYTFPTAKVKTRPTDGSDAGMGSRYYYALRMVVYNGSTQLLEKTYGNSNTVANGTTWATLAGGSGGTLYTSSLFTSSNKTLKTVTLTAKTGGYLTMDSEWGTSYPYASPEASAGTFTVTLNAPPTFSETFSYTGDFSGVPYANLTTASVSLSSLSAKYGGDFSGVGNAEFIIGSQSVSKPNPVNGDVLTIALNAVGTFTPMVKITDSRGQVATHTLSEITVMGYNAPTVSFDVDRTTSAGVPDDEGTYGLIEATFTFTDVIADAVVPSVVVTDDSGTQTTPVVTWYTDSGLTTPVTWSSLSSGDTVYGIFSGLSTQHSYTVSVRPRDSEGTGTAVTQTIGAAFYTVDFLAGGHGIAFGKPAANVGFECAMEATFEDTLQADGTATFGSDVLIDLPDYQTADTTDKAIYDAIVALGWDSDVLIN